MTYSEPLMREPSLHRGLSTVEYFTFGFGTMIGVGWLVLMDDWLSRGGPAGGILGFLIGGLLLFPIAHTYGRLVQRIRDAGAEIAYSEGVFPPFVSYAAGWTMVLSYAIVCPWEAVATGNLLARVFPSLNSYQLYVVGGSPIYAPLVAGFLFCVIIIAVVTYVYPWQEIVSGHVRTEVEFERTFGSHAIAQLILFGAFLSLLKIFNGNFVAATRMMYAIGRRNLVHPSLGQVDATRGTPVVAIGLMAALTAAAAMFGDAILVPITEVGSLAVGVGWLSACAAYLARHGRDRYAGESGAMAAIGCAVSVAIVLMKAIPGGPGSFPGLSTAVTRARFWAVRFDPRPPTSSTAWTSEMNS